jgi:hypothetical protein
MWDVVDIVALRQVFPSLLRFSAVNSTGAPLLGKGQKIIIFFFMVLQKKA